ncbi:MAG: NAD(+)/NADH kinase [Microbacterium ginsengisoli]|uniref:diacylglycerol/lipid kinase family protein n=1 Tax=Microbacterium TaxID=33882 RepID=UPI0006FBDB4F|nr:MULTISPECIES: diacylglycerol kinase family protein [unclassified Microbacterium]KQR90975.1 transcriptional regulator [Microbacterium sp. Leaf347]KQS00026.1 transcriptional regulator [Microbacterium sp. Leaf351]MBN9199733.1 NAD(+)/NADH kinase [Microbacterium ginsengisoli]OJU75256.1 MAG: transcriptional regulator [Microbacterium sp. 71-23]
MIATASQLTAGAHAAVVYNPAKISIDRVRPAVTAQQRSHGWEETRWFETASEDSGRCAAEQALAGEPTVVIVVGGDGTVRAAAEVMQGTGIPIALVPAGTGNLLARDLGVPLNDISACVSVAFSGELRNVDVGVAELEELAGRRASHVFMVMAGIGLDAAMAQNTSTIAKRHLGWFAYVAPIARSIIANRLFHLDYRIDRGRARSTRAHTVIVGNCGTLTGNMLLIPAAVIDDGLLDVVMMRPRGRFGWARIGTRLTLQGIARRSRLSRELLRRAPVFHALAYVQGRQFEARFETPHLVELDGDSFGHAIRVRVSVRPGALGVRVTARANPSGFAEPSG